MNNSCLLLIDDEIEILNSLKFNLKDHANEILLAENGVEALEILKKHEVHCLICDINMPKMNGLELIKEIRKDGNNVPFIIYTAYGSHNLMMEAVKYGVFDFLNKPELLNKLFNLILSAEPPE